MSDHQSSADIIVYTMPEPAPEPGEYDRVRGDHEASRDLFGRPQKTTVSVTQLQQQINVFLVQMGDALKETPTEAGGFKLTEIEIAAGITAGLEIALLGIGGGKGEITGGLHFVFKRS